MALPTALAGALISVPASGAVAALATTLMVVSIPEAPLNTLLAPLTVTWGMFGVMFAVYHPIEQIAGWSWEYFQRAHELLEEARDRKLELEQALQDLAHANLQLTRLNSLAQGLRQIAEEARAAKAQFVANVSHELRTPLNMIIGFSEMILQTPETYGTRVPPALLADLDVINRNAEHLADLVDDVLDLSQIEADQTALTREYVYFPEILEVATTAVRPLFDSKGLYLTSDISDGLPRVFCDSVRIREVLLNLLSNAGRFTERGGVHLSVAHDQNSITVSVADSGPGIAAEDMTRLFLR